ncbi:hypothetical protein ACC811_37060, partial [Rhizobium ruizarguesonis]
KWGTAVWGVAKFPVISLVRKFASAGGAGSALAPTIRALISGSSVSVSEAAVVGGSVLYEKGTPILSSPNRARRSRPGWRVWP